MRRILIDNARRKKSKKRTADPQPANKQPAELVISVPHEELLTLDEALTRLETVRPDAAKVVNLRYFAGLSLDEIASALNVSRKTVTRYWAFARAWLYKEIGDDKS